MSVFYSGTYSAIPSAYSAISISSVQLGSETSLAIDDRIQSLIEKGKIFKTSNGTAIEQIFYSNDVGVILQAEKCVNQHTGLNEWGIYFASKDADEFIRCDSEFILGCLCIQVDCAFSVFLPGELKKHTLKIALARVAPQGHDIEISWDGMSLDYIDLRQY